MTRKHWILVAALMLLGGVYVYWFTDWVVPPQIQIEVSTRPSGRGSASSESPVLPTLFMLDREYAFSSLEVIAVSNVPATLVGKTAWHLAAQGEPERQRGFAYGETLKGYRTVVAPLPLIPGALYRVDLKAGRARGSRTFSAIPAAPSRAE
jgi:hypothetical protein